MGFWKSKPPCGVRVSPTHPLAQGMVGCWLFNEMSGKLSNDWTGSGRNLTLSTGNNASFGAIGGAVGFLSTLASMQAIGPIIPMTAMTIVARVTQSSTSGFQTFGSADGGGSLRNWYFAVSAGKYDIAVWNSGATLANPGTYPTVPAAGQMYQAAMTYNGVNIGAYTNGVRVLPGAGSEALAGPMRQAAQNTAIGRDVGGNGLLGVFDSVLLYNRALSPLDISTLYADPYAMMAAPPVVRRLFFIPPALSPRDRRAALVTSTRRNRTG